MIVAGLFGGGCDLGGPLMWFRIFWLISGSVTSALTRMMPLKKN